MVIEDKQVVYGLAYETTYIMHEIMTMVLIKTN